MQLWASPGLSVYHLVLVACVTRSFLIRRFAFALPLLQVPLVIGFIFETVSNSPPRRLILRIRIFGALPVVLVLLLLQTDADNILRFLQPWILSTVDTVSYAYGTATFSIVGWAYNNTSAVWIRTATILVSGTVQNQHLTGRYEQGTFILYTCNSAQVSRIDTTPKP